MLAFLQNLFMPPVPAFAKAVTVEEASKLMAENPDLFLLDVRTEQEYAEKHYEGAVLIPVSELAARAAEVPRDKDVLIYCRSGNRAKAALRYFEDRKDQAIYFLDGFPKYE